MSKIDRSQKIQRWRGRIVCWATHPHVRNYTGNARSRVMHLVRVQNKYPYPATVCGMAVSEYSVVSKSNDNSKYTGRQLCEPCLNQLDQDKVYDPTPGEHAWGGKTAEEIDRERHALAVKIRELEYEGRNLAIRLGAAQAESRAIEDRLSHFEKKCECDTLPQKLADKEIVIDACIEREKELMGQLAEARKP